MTWIDYLGILAGTMTTSSFIPQVVKTWQTQKSDDLSLQMILLYMSGMSLWLFYGIILKNIPIIGANIAGLSFVMTLLVLKCRYDHKSSAAKGTFAQNEAMRMMSSKKNQAK